MNKKDKLSAFIGFLWILTVIVNLITIILIYIENKHGYNFFLPISVVCWGLLFYAIFIQHTNPKE